MRLKVTLIPRELLRVRKVSLELALLTTYFSRTALDGYHEYTSKRVWRIIDLCDELRAQPGVALVYSPALNLPIYLPTDSRPAKVQWQAMVRFEIVGYRVLQAAVVLGDASPSHWEGPVVDGRGFLPLYEFRAGSDS